VPALYRQFKCVVCIALGTIFFINCLKATAYAAPLSDKIKFDTKLLAERGFSADVASFFAREMRFLPGVQQVKISVNAGRSQTREVRFNQNGEICFDRSLLRQLTLRVPENLEDGICMKAQQLFPGMRVEQKPGISQVNLIVPEEAFDPAARESAMLHGGWGALLNYNIFAQQFQGNGMKQSYLHAQIDPGLNWNNWVFRSHGTYTSNQAGASYQQQDIYAQRNIEAIRSIFQTGKLSAQSEAYAGVPIIGAQLFSDSAQLNSTALIVPIQGMATTNAVIELRQRGQIVYRTVVPPGPYLLSEVGGLIQGADIEVQVTEEDGKVSRYTVPTPMINAGAAEQPASFHMGFGRYRDNADATQVTRAPWLFYGDYSYSFSPQLRLSNAGLIAQGYQNASSQAMLAFDGNSWISSGLRVSRSPLRGLGYEWQAQGASSLGGNFSGGVTWQTRSQHFSSLEETLGQDQSADYASPSQQSLGLSLSWASPKWGAFSYSATQSRNRSQTSIFHMLSASRKIGRANVNLTLQKGNDRGNAVYLSASLPIGKNSLSTRLYRQQKSPLSMAVNYRGSPRPDINYQLDASKTGNDSRFSASAQVRTAYAQLAGGVSQTGHGIRSFHGTATGSVAFVGSGGLATSASKVGDTFAVVNVPLSGLRMQAPGGSVKTSRFNTALVPSVYPYQRTRIQVDGKSLPLSYRLETTMFDLNLARGTVATQEIGATSVRQLMLQVKMPDDTFASIGMSVLDAQGEFMGTVVGEGNVILSNADIGKPVYLENSAQSRCEVRYQVPEKFDPESPYEEASAICVSEANNE